MGFYLNTHTYYSLRYGTLSVERVINRAKEAGAETVAITDINNTTAIPDAVNAARNAGIHLLAGAEIHRRNRLVFTLLARNNEGFREINEFLSHHNMRKKTFPVQAPAFRDVYVVYPPGYKVPDALLPNERIGVRPGEVNGLFWSDFPRDASCLIVWQPVTFETRKQLMLHKHLRAIDNNTLLSQLKSADVANTDEFFPEKDELLQNYADYPRIVKNTEELAADCSIDFDFREVKNRQTFTGSEADDRALLKKLAYDGLAVRYNNSKKAAGRVDSELQVIFKLGFSAYFLITWDIVRYSMNRGFRHVGRGSGANSVVAYCLYITDVDPVALNLYFERFINPKRTSPPDFDIDYSWKVREEVQDYIFKRYGGKYTALLGAISTFRGRSIYRELGKVYGLPKEEIDNFIREPASSLNRNDITRRITAMGKMMEDFPNLRTIHAGGILISEWPISYYTALDMPPKSFPVTQWDMYVAEDLGFEKFDILSQRGIGHISEGVELVRRNKGVEVDIRDVDTCKKDSKTRDLLKRGEATGCFYIESPAMRGLLQKLQCNDYYTLVAASSIVRPGVAKSGMMKEYIRRHRNPGSYRYAHPVMKEQLQDTYGVMVYQEDVLKVGHHFAGLDLADADILRRAMSGKSRSQDEFQRIKDKFFANCRSRGYDENLIAEVWRQIASFAGYSFPKAHSASFAVESFQSLYLKAYYPLEFLVAVINNYGGFYPSWVYFHEAARYGGVIRLPSVNYSFEKTSVYGTVIYIGFAHISSLELNTVSRLLEARGFYGEFTSLPEFVYYVKPDFEQLLVLIRVGAFRFTGKSKSRLMWEAHTMMGSKKERITQGELFRVSEPDYTLPELPQTKKEDAYDEIELLGFPVSLSLFDLLKTKFRGDISAADMVDHPGRVVRMTGNLVTAKRTQTSRNERMYFGTFLDSTGEFFDTVNFPDSLKRYPYQGSGIYLILGKITVEYGFASLTVKKMAKLPLQTDPREE